MNVGFIGSGKMATALVHGVIKAGAVNASNILVSDVHAPAVEKLAASSGAVIAHTNAQIARAADVIVLCVKPNDALAALREVDSAGKLIISIVAGLSIAALQEATGQTARIIRVMPNTPALVGRGAAAYALGSGVTPEDAAVAESIFGSVGTVSVVKEELLDVVTGLSGSGPAYIYLMIEALADGAVLMGLPRDLAVKLAAQTAAGAAEMVLQTGEHPAALRDAVTSPGGTTSAGLEALEESAVRAGLIRAVRAGTERARELGREK